MAYIFLILLTCFTLLPASDFNAVLDSAFSEAGIQRSDIAFPHDWLNKDEFRP